MPAFNALRRPALGKTTRRWLYLVHRWIGIASCLFFAMWFLSGLVMVYVPYPSLSPAENLAGSEAIDWAVVNVPPPLDGGRLSQELLLEMRDGAPVWRVTGWDGTHTTLAASRGTVLRPVDARYAGRVADRFGNAPTKHVERLTRDQWTVASGFDRTVPFGRLRLPTRPARRPMCPRVRAPSFK